MLSAFNLATYLLVTSSLPRSGPLIITLTQKKLPANKYKDFKAETSSREVQASCSCFTKVLIHSVALTGHCHPNLATSSNFKLIIFSPFFSFFFFSQ